MAMFSNALIRPDGKYRHRVREWAAGRKDILAGCALAGLAAWPRLHGLGDYSLTLDESTIVEFARGVLEHGYPVVKVGSMEVPLATYELLPYVMAPFLALLGQSDFAIRLSAALFGIATTYLIYDTSMRWFDRRVGILAALLYAFSPWAIYWGQSSFHPSQTQFFAFLAVRGAQSLLRAEAATPRAAYLAALFFCLAFLSWEGMGFLLPVVFVTGLVLNRGDWRWLKNVHLWLAIAIAAVVVVGQGVRRVLVQDSFLMVGSGKSEVSMPQLVFTQTDYSPAFYLKNFFGTETHVVLSMVFLLGLMFIRRNGNLRFVSALVITAIVLMTNFLPFYSAHYVYYLLPWFLIATSAMTFEVIDGLAASPSARFGAVRAAHAVFAGGLILLEIASATPAGLKLYELDKDWQNPYRQDLRVGLAGIDYRGPVETLAAQYRDGDVIVSLAPFPLKLYGGLSDDYYLQSVAGQKVVYDPAGDSPYYIEKYAGNPVLRSLAEFEDMLYRHDRVWLLAAPYGIFTSLQDRALLDFIDKHMTVKADSYDARLYLWSR